MAEEAKAPEVAEEAKAPAAEASEPVGIPGRPAAPAYSPTASPPGSPSIRPVIGSPPRDDGLSGRGPAGRRPTLAEPSWPGARVILLALDTSDNAKRAFDWFMDNVFRADDVLILAHCPEAPKLPSIRIKSGFAPPVDEWKKILDNMNSKTRMLEEEYEATCIQKKLRYKVRGEITKNPGEGIVKIAYEEDVHLIVMGTRGTSGIKRALLGSVSDYVARNVQVPVVLVPAPTGIDKQLLKAAAGSSQ